MTCLRNNASSVSKYERSRTYRKLFFKCHSPDCLGLYFCVYCGKLLDQKKVCVDHVIPVHAAKNDKRIQKKIKRYGYDGINDWRNLVASCRRCNSRKGKKRGIWILRARIGRSYAFQLLRAGIRVTIVVSAVVMATGLYKYV